MIREAKVAAGGVGTVPWKLPAVERHLIGERSSEPLWTAAERAAEGSRPLRHNRFKVGPAAPDGAGRAVERTTDSWSCHRPADEPNRPRTAAYAVSG